MRHTGLSVEGLLLVAFIVLKLCGFIHWSWWWVLAPAWIPALFLLACFLVGSALWWVCRIYERRIDRKIDHTLGRQRKP